MPAKPIRKLQVDIPPLLGEAMDNAPLSLRQLTIQGLENHPLVKIELERLGRENAE